MTEREYKKSRISKLFLSWLLTLAIAVTATWWPVTGSVAVSAADEFITVGTGIKTGGTTPYYASCKNAAVELLYTASGIKRAGGSAGEIDAIAFNVTASGPLETELLEIYMTQTMKISSISTSLYTEGLKKVFSGNPTLGKETGWENITLDTPFEWDGESNIVIVLSRKGSAYNTEVRYAYTAGSNKVAYRGDDKADSTMADIDNSASMYTVGDYLPNIRFTIDNCQHEHGKTLEIIDPTCTEDGYELFQCDDCGKTVPIHKKSARGHVFTEAIGKEPTCTEDGTRIITCEGCDYKEVEAIPALGHDWDWENAIIDEHDNQTATCRNHCGETQTRNLKVDTWEGDWPEPDSEAGFSGGAGTAEDPYLIGSADDLAQLAVNVNNFSTRTDYISKYYKQTIGIDLHNELWTPIANTTISNEAFAGNYDGGGFRIDGVNVTTSSTLTGYYGLFGYIAANGNVHHLIVSGENTSTGNAASSYIGGIAGYNAGTIEYCVNYVNVTSANNGAGIAGYGYGGTIANCENRGNITVSNSTNAAYSYAGGIAAYLGGSGQAVIRNCSNYGDITNESTVASAKLVQSGGIAGNGYCDGAKISNCFNQGTVKAISAANENTESFALAGGIVGLCTNPTALTIENCYNAGTITAECAKAPTYALCGQILGNMFYQASSTSAVMKTVTISNCFWTRNEEGVPAFHNELPYHATTEYRNHGIVVMDEASSYVSDNTELLEKLNAWVAENNTEDNLYLPWEADEDGLPVSELCEHKLVFHHAVEATCTKAGFQEYWTCSICNQLFSDAEGNTKIKAPVTIEATGHSWGEKQVTKAPTDTQEGEAARKCSVCGETEYSVIPKLERSENTKEVDAAIEGGDIDKGSSGNTLTDTIKKGKTYTVGGMEYKVTKAAANGTGTVTLSGTTKLKSKLKKLTVKSTVKIGGKSFKVTAIGAKSFKGYKKLTSVTVGKNVKTIGAEAFSKCKSLKKMIITSSSLKKVEKKAIRNINNKAVIKVPAKKRAAYRKLFQTKTGYKRTMKVK